MKLFLHPIPIACLLLAVVGAARSDIVVVILALLAGTAAIGFLSVRHDSGRSSGPEESLSADGRMLLRQVKRLADEIQAFVRSNSGSEIIHIIGFEASAEATRLEKQATASLVARDELRKLVRGRFEADRDLGVARMKLEFATGAEKQSLNLAIEARTAELRHYEKVETRIKHIELDLQQAEAALAEMKARLSVSVSGERADASTSDELRASISRMRSISDGYDEAERMVTDS